MLVACDVSDDAQIDACFAEIGKRMGGLDILVHSVAAARREELTGDFRDTSRDGYRMALEISAYSFVALARRAVPLMEGRQGKMLTLSYIAAERAVPHYNVMGSAKAALEQAVRQLALELGPLGIASTASRPGRSTHCRRAASAASRTCSSSRKRKRPCAAT